VDDSASLRARLESGLRAAGCADAEVQNGAVAGYSSGQQALRYANLAETLRPDVLVVVFNHEDLADAIRRIGASSESGDDDAFDTDVDARAAHLPAWLREPRLSIHRWRNSAALRILSNWTRSAPALHRALGGLGLVEYEAPPVELWPFSLRAETAAGWDLGRASLGAMKQAVGASGGSMLVLDAPSVFEVDAAAWQRLHERTGCPSALAAVGGPPAERHGESPAPLVQPRPALSAPRPRSLAHWPGPRPGTHMAMLVASSSLSPIAGICAAPADDPIGDHCKLAHPQALRATQPSATRGRAVRPIGSVLRLQLTRTPPRAQ
jgi:hypothetical protein